MRIEIEVATVPLVAGTPTDVTLRIENQRRGSVFWLSDGCAIPGVASVRLNDPGWIGGDAQTGIAREFKTFALEGPRAGFTPLGIGLPGDWPPEGAGCGDVGIVNELQAGAVVERTLHWTGAAETAIPAGPAEIDAGFAFSRTRKVDDWEASTSVEIRLPTWISSDQVVDFIPPGPAIDVALDDTRFRSWLEESDSATWTNSNQTLDVKAGTWEIGLFRDGPGFYGSVTFDARTGEVLDHRFEG